MSTEHTEYILYQLENHFVLFSAIFLLIGYILGMNLRNQRQTINIKETFDDEFDEIATERPRQKQRQKTTTKKRKPITIDETTHVVKIKTDGMEKKYDKIGEEQTTNEDISAGINKLKNLIK